MRWKPWRVDYHQYLIVDPAASPDWSIADTSSDGVLGPVPGGVRVSTGLQHGTIELEAAYLSQGVMPSPPGDGITSECSVESLSGTLLLSTTLGEETLLVVGHEQPGWWRVRVTVWNRDVGPERHQLVVVPSSGPEERLSPIELDEVGYAMSGRPRPRNDRPVQDSVEPTNRPLINVTMAWAGLDVPEGQDARDVARESAAHAVDMTAACEINWLGYGAQPDAWPPTDCPTATYAIVASECRAERCARHACGGHYLCGRHAGLAKRLTGAEPRPWTPQPRRP